MDEIDLWGTSEESVLCNRIEGCRNRLLNIELAIHAQELLLADSGFIKKYRIDIDSHSFRLKSLQRERQELKKILRATENQLTKLKVSKDLFTVDDRG